MKKINKSFVFIFLIAIFSNSTIFAKNRTSNYEIRNVGIDINYLIPSFENIFVYNNALKNSILINVNSNIVASPPTVTTP
ncbi:MAG: hypothetical protein RL619_1742, partial [Bacteroidota bacterium]